MAEVANLQQGGNALLEDLKWRGLMFQSSDEASLAKALDTPLKFYCGFDPTAPSLHHGNLVQLILMRHLQNAGHTPYCIVGGATGLIGDPRQSGERVLNPAETVRAWSDKLSKQFKRFLSSEGSNAVQVLNNYDWTEGISALEFLRDIGKNFRMGTMLAKDTVKSRLNGEGLSYTEFSYQVLQGYDYYYLNKNYGITLQTGGQDQWGNLTSGTDLIGKLSLSQNETTEASDAQNSQNTNEHANVHILTTPLITKADGSKFGKSEGGAIWLNNDMMSAYEFYQFWINIEDEEVIKLLKVFTFLSREEIAALEQEVINNPGARVAQKTLAKEVTIFVHGEDAYNDAVKASSALFSNENLQEINPNTLLAATSGLDQANAKVGDKIGEIFINSNLASSFGDFRRTLQAGGVYLNNQKVLDQNQVLTESDLITTNDGTTFALVRKGKKNLAAVFVGDELSEITITGAENG